MKKKTPLLLAALLLMTLPAYAGGIDGDPVRTYTYMCKVGKQKYPVTVDQDKDTITWRGQTYTNLTLGENCRYEFFATRDGVTATLCTATKGYAGLTIGKPVGERTADTKDDFDCRMK